MMNRSPRGLHKPGTVRRASAVLVAATFALAMILTACSATEPAQAQRKPDVETRAVIDATGESIQVPTDPQRIVALSEPTLDAALALDAPLVGTVTGRGQQTVPNYLQDRAGDLTLLGGIAQPNFEAIGAASPDLILVDGTSINNNPPVLEALAQLAPVVYTGFAGGDWRDNLRFTADALNRVDEGERLIDEYDARVADARQLLGDYDGQTFSIVRWQGNSAALILKELLPGQALEDLGLARPPAQDRIGRGHSEPVSQENLPDIDADWMFFGTLGGSSVGNPQAGGGTDVTDAERALADAVATPGFTQLGAYQRDQIIPVDGSSWTSTGGPILMNRIIDDVLGALVPESESEADNGAGSTGNGDPESDGTGGDATAVVNQATNPNAPIAAPAASGPEREGLRK